MEIHWKGGSTLRPEEREAIESRLRALEGGHRDLIDVRIALEDATHHRHGAKEARIACRLLGREVVSSRTADDLRLALDQATDVFEQEVRRSRSLREIRHEERPSGPPHLGIIDRVLAEQGYGFILTDAGERVYFHRNAVRGELDFARLEEGQRVALNFEAGREGLQATAVVAPPPGAAVP